MTRNHADRNALKIVMAALDWSDNSVEPRCVYCSTSLWPKKTPAVLGGWVAVVAEPPSESVAVVGVCPQCIERKDLLARALKQLEIQTDIVVEVGHKGHA